MVVLGIDPGREKCGIAVVTEADILWQGICDTKDLPAVCKCKIEEYQAAGVVIGNGTSSKQAVAALKDTVREDVKIIVVDEYRTTDAARKLYWQENPPRGLMRLLPIGMLVPPVPVDDYAARILAARHLGAHSAAADGRHRD